MVAWLEKNKKFIIGFLATLTTTFFLFIFQKIALYKNRSSIQNYVDNQEVDNALMFMVTMDILIKIMVGVSAVYFILVLLKIVFSVLKNKFWKGEKA